jgi:NAD(P)-dependent dehydrogenase (short-subunit alcohol dehydrogenase family)
MKAALTGATGFIGSHVLADLHKHGHEVTALVRDDTQADTVAARGATPAVVGLYDQPTVSKRRLYCDTALSWGDPVLRLLRDVVGISPELTDSERTTVLGVTATKLIPRLAALRPQTQPHAS